MGSGVDGRWDEASSRWPWREGRERGGEEGEWGMRGGHLMDVEEEEEAGDADEIRTWFARVHG
jgi:hypothetical protein